MIIFKDNIKKGIAPIEIIPYYEVNIAIFYADAVSIVQPSGIP